MTENITCPRCRHRHPADRSCEEMKRLATEAWQRRHMEPDGTMQREQELLDSALECLREIAALAGTTKRKQAGSEQAITWLHAHGYALEEGGYVPGVGFEDGVPALARRQAE